MEFEHDSLLPFAGLIAQLHQLDPLSHNNPSPNRAMILIW